MNPYKYKLIRGLKFSAIHDAMYLTKAGNTIPGVGMKKTTSVEGEVSEFQFGWHDWERNEFYPLDMDEELPPELMTALREDGAAKVIVRLIRDGIGELQKAVAADLESLYLMIEGEDD